MNIYLVVLLVLGWIMAMSTWGMAPVRASDDGHWLSKVDESVWAIMDSGPGEFLTVLADQADLQLATDLRGKEAKGRFVQATLREHAVRSQAPLLAILEDVGVDYRPYWIINMIWVRADVRVLEMLAHRDDVARFHANPRVRLAELQPTPAPDRQTGQRNIITRDIVWNIEHVRGPEVWARGYTGQGALVGGIDTGYDWQHPALQNQYRGWDGVSADHDYNWHDAIHTGDGPCGADSPEPCDDNGHGTHTLGTMVGDDGGSNRVGLAPGARWIGCRCMDQAWASPATFLECLEWMVAPYPVGGTPAQGDPTLAPDVINCSWGCPENAGCTWETLQPAIAAVRAAGIVVVASAGGGGPGCSSIEHPPAIYGESLTVSGTDAWDLITPFSGRGPVTVDSSGRLKPDVCAPATEILSSWPGGEYELLTGTSMAAPHVAGLVALLVSADSLLSGDVDQIESLIEDSAVLLESDQCGDGTEVPNNVYGHGRMDAFAAWIRTVVGVEEAEPGMAPQALRLWPSTPNPFNPRTTISYDLPTTALVSLRIFDMTGRLIRVLVAGEWVPAGHHSSDWNGRDTAGRMVAAGTYFYRLETLDHAETQRMTLLK